MLSTSHSSLLLIITTVSTSHSSLLLIITILSTSHSSLLLIITILSTTHSSVLLIITTVATSHSSLLIITTVSTLASFKMSSFLCWFQPETYTHCSSNHYHLCCCQLSFIYSRQSPRFTTVQKCWPITMVL